MDSSNAKSKLSSGHREVGRVVGVWRYPVKSMSAEELEDAELWWHGLAGDRRWAFVRTDQQRNGFPWLTIRERPTMVQYQPRLSDPKDPEKADVRVLTPSGADLDVTDPTLAAELGGDLQLIKQSRGVFDTLPISLITTQTIAALGALVSADLDARRFRPNLLISTADKAPYLEDNWVGRALQIGTARMRVDKRDQRCVVVNVDPETTKRNSSILRAIATARSACLGVYAQTMVPGRVAVGDRVVLED